MAFKNSDFAVHTLAITNGSPGYPFVPFVKIDREQLTLRMLMEQLVAEGSDITLGEPLTCATRSEVDAVYARHASPGVVEAPQLGTHRLVPGQYLDPEWKGLAFTELGAVSIAIDAARRPKEWVGGSIWVFPIRAKGPGIGTPLLPFARHVHYPQADLKDPAGRWASAQWAALRAERHCHVILKVSPPENTSTFDECRFSVMVMTPTGSRATILGDLAGKTTTTLAHSEVSNPFSRIPMLA